jgi:hypothetical protein
MQCQFITMLIIIIIIIIKFLTSQPQLGNIHVSWDVQSIGLASMDLFILLIRLSFCRYRLFVVFVLSVKYSIFVRVYSSFVVFASIVDNCAV